MTDFDVHGTSYDLKVPTTVTWCRLIVTSGKPERRAHALELWIRQMLVAPLEERSAVAALVMADPGLRRSFLEQRARWFRELRDAGTSYARCPHCGLFEADSTLGSLEAALREVPFVDGDLLMAHPALAQLRSHGVRPDGIATTDRVRVQLPSTIAGLPGAASGDAVLGTISVGAPDPRSTEAWNRWAPPGATQRGQHAHRDYRNAAFRAVLRLCVALERLGDVADITPDHLEPLPCVDVLFLDALYHLLHRVDVTEELAVTCGACAQPYLPVRPGLPDG